MSRPAYFVGPWDLDRRLACVPDDPSDGTVVMVESVAKGSALPYHRKKLVLVLSAMHHFAAELRADGFDVHIVNAPTYVDGIRRHVEETGATSVIALEPREWGLDRALRAADLGAPLDLRSEGGDGGHFLLTRDAFLGWAATQKKKLRMDSFYRWMRERTDTLMEDGAPVGGKWSFDADNRKPAKGETPPEVPAHRPDALTQQIMERVATWPDHWGSVDGFAWPVTRAGALAELDDFIARRLPTFGDYQDAMLDGQDMLWHARLSSSLNVGLLHPQEVCDAAIDAWVDGHAPLNCVEGFVRQVMGWREFIRGVYWLRMPDLRQANLLEADEPLPDFFWDESKTEMRCVSEAVRNVRENGYAHHIQRLMVLGNLAMLLGVRPLEISHWFWAGFVDAYEWVELPNVHGMAVYADDTFTTKPYAASGNYIRKMSDHCRHCPYDVKQRYGEDACPFNPLFWDFMVRHRERLRSNPRLARLYATYDRKSAEEREGMAETAAGFRASLAPSDHGWSFDDDAC